MKYIGKDIGAARQRKEYRALLNQANYSVYALRKIACIDIDYHANSTRAGRGSFVFSKQKSDLRTLARFSGFTGPDIAYVEEAIEDFIDQARLGLPDAKKPPIVWPLSSAIPIDRIDIRGGLRRDELANFYGLDGRDVAVNVATAIAAIAGRKFMPERLANFANALLEATGYEEHGEADRRGHHIVHADDVVRVTFGKPGDFGHAAGFAASTWQDLERDKSLWKLLVTSKESQNSYAQMFIEGRRYLFALTHEVQRLGKLDRAARIFCYLSHSMCLLSTDPIWIRPRRMNCSVGTDCPTRRRSTSQIRMAEGSGA